MRRISAIAFLLAFPILAHAQSGEWGSRGISQRFVVRGSLVFAADGRGVAVYDLSQPAIRRVAVAETDAESTDLALIGDGELDVATRAGVERYSIAGDGTLARSGVAADEIASRIASNGTELAGITQDGITVWDAGTRQVVARHVLSPAPASLAWHGSTLLAAVPNVGVFLYGGGDPVVLPEDARDLAMNGDTLFIAAGPHGLAEYDLKSATPKLAGLFGTGAVDFATVAATGSRVFVTEQPDQVHVFDLSSGTPVETASFRESAQAIAAADTRLFVSGMLFDSFGVAGSSGVPLRVFDAADSSSPRMSGEFRDLAGPLSGVATDGTLAWVVDPPYFRVIDISTTSSPREMANLKIDGTGTRVKVQGSRAIVFGRGDVDLLDISNPRAPRLLKVFHSSGGPPSGAAFARDTIVEANDYSGFHVVDFDHFDEPRQIGGLKGHYTDAAAQGDTAWIMYMGSSLMSVDISAPTDARIAKASVVGGLRTDIAPANGHHGELLLVLSADGVHLLSIDTPLNPFEVGFRPMTSATSIAADGDFAWVAAPGTVQSIDLANTAVQQTPMRAVAPMDIAAKNGKIVVADRYSLRIYGPNTAPPPPPPAPRRRPSGS